jgi:hypothetical protein
LRDYSGFPCTGTVVAAAPRRESSPTTRPPNVDYPGPQPQVPDKINQLRLALDLKVREPKK